MSNQKILLINTLEERDYWEKVTPKTAPISHINRLLSVATLLKQNGFQPKIIDSYVEPDYFHLIQKEIEKEKPLLVLVSLIVTTIRPALEISRFIKKLDRNLPLVWGSVLHPFFGSFVPLYPKQVLANDLIDFALLSEEEATLLELAQLLKENKKSKIQQLKTVLGLGFKNGKEIILNPRRIITQGELINEDFSLVDVEKYINRTGNLELGFINSRIRRLFVLTTTKGCPYRCTFCINSSELRQNFRQKTAEQVIKQIEEAILKYKADTIWFQDDNFLANVNRLKKIFDAVEKKGLNFEWAGQGRLNYFNPHHISDKLFKKISKNCIWFGVGFETISDRLRKIYQKSVTKEMLEHVAELCKKNNVFFGGVAFIVGTVNETRREMLDTVLYILDFKKRFPYSGITYQVYRPYPGTIEYQKAKARGYQEPQTLEEWAEKVQPDLRGVSYFKYPWLKDENKIDIIRYLLNIVHLVEVSNLSFRKGMRLWYLVAKIFSPLFRFRLRHDWWHFPIEFQLIKIGKKFFKPPF